MKLDTFTYAYLHAAAFTEDRNPGQGEYLEPAIDDFDPAFVARAMADCQSFQAACWDLIIEDLDHAGGDFWYTRNGHGCGFWDGEDRKSTRLNSSHQIISYAVFCLKKKKKNKHEN